MPFVVFEFIGCTMVFICTNDNMVMVPGAHPVNEMDSSDEIPVSLLSDVIL